MASRRDPSYLRRVNRSLILQLLRAEGPLSRVDIAEKTHLSPPTSSLLVSQLEDEGLVCQVGTGESSGGRHPILYDLRPNGAYAVGVDLGITWIRTAVVNLKGETIVCRKSPTEITEYDGMVDFLAAEVLAALKEADLTPQSVVGAGFGLHGLVDPDSGIIRFSPYFGWRNVSAAEDLRRRLSIPVRIDNDVRAMARGERWYGAARRIPDFVAINVGAGIGGAVMIGDRLLTGVSSGAGEIGHLIVDDDGVRCECGNYGCLTKMASGPSIARLAARRIKQGEPSVLSSMVSGDLNRITAEHIGRAARQGDELAVRAVSDAGRYVGVAVAHVISFLNPGLIIVGGGVTQSGAVFWDALRQAAGSRALSGSFEDTTITGPELGEMAGSVGAATLAYGSLFAGHAYQPVAT